LNYPRKIFVWLTVALTVAVWVTSAWALGADAEPQPGSRIEPRDLTPEVFLKYARQPFVQNAWGRFSGTIQFRGENGKHKLPVYFSLLFRADFMRVQVILDETDVYNVMQVYYREGTPSITIEKPEAERAPSLADLGIKPEDITFSFLYWDLVKEVDGEEVRGHDCRVMNLVNPRTGDTATVWFSAEYLFPLKVICRDKGAAETEARTLEFTDFERHGDIWYVKNLRLEGNNWKTRVKFTDGEIFPTEDKLPPPNLFLTTP
jgi:hypothetical protein